MNEDVFFSGFFAVEHPKITPELTTTNYIRDEVTVTKLLAKEKMH